MTTPGYSKLREAQTEAVRAFKLQLDAALAMSDAFDRLNTAWLASEATVERIAEETRTAATEALILPLRCREI